MYAFVPNSESIRGGTLPLLQGLYPTGGPPVPDQPSVVETLRIVRGFLSLARIAHDQPADF